jgi:hypothetical protein
METEPDRNIRIEQQIRFTTFKAFFTSEQMKTTFGLQNIVYTYKENTVSSNITNHRGISFVVFDLVNYIDFKDCAQAPTTMYSTVTKQEDT